jgi:hypothetical protein
VQAYTTVSTRLASWLVIGLLLGACDWQPVARPVQPELVLEGDFRLVARLDEGERYVLLTSTAGPRTFTIVDLRTRESCTLPPGTTSAATALRPPAGSDLDEVPLFKLAIGVKDNPDDDSDAQQLFTAQPDCTVEGPYGRLGSGPWTLTLDENQRSVAIWGDGSGTMNLYDPWTGQQRVVARNVEHFEVVARVLGNNGPIGPQTLWIREATAEGGATLNMRTLDGTLLHTLGRDVGKFRQATFDTLRIAWEEGDDVYEASGDEFAPFLIQEDACEPFYYGASLNMFHSCEAEQLVRFDLITAMLETFPPGVSWSYTDGGVLLEYAREESTRLLYATAAGGQRTLVMPTLWQVQVIDARRLAGITGDRRFGVWSAAEGFVPMFSGVHDITPFIDVRAGNYVWLMLHEEAEGVGRLSVFDQDSFVLQTLALNVPTNGYSVEFLEAVPEPLVVTIEDTVPGDTLRGTLRARLLSGELSSTVDTDVTSYDTLAAPLPGLLYTVAEESKRGLWFAAL